jgi:hypothetical protein
MDGKLSLTTPVHTFTASPSIRKDLVDRLRMHPIDTNSSEGAPDGSSVQVNLILASPRTCISHAVPLMMSVRAQVSQLSIVFLYSTPYATRMTVIRPYWIPYRTVRDELVKGYGMGYGTGYGTGYGMGLTINQPY